MSIKSILLFLLSLIYSNLAFSQLYNGSNLNITDLNELSDRVKPGTILLLGENHGLASHRNQHVEILQALRQKGLKISVGLEFINYTDQLFVDQYRDGRMSETDFLSAVKWSGFGFEFYRPQLLFPLLDRGEKSLGLNLTRIVTSKISKQGLASLTAEDWSLMPPNFALGRDSYKARFMIAAGAHCKVPDNCFAAQCAWDDTMAWQAVNFISEHPDQVLVIVVGEFHVQFGGGIKHRILQRLPGAEVVTLSQIWGEGMTDDEIKTELQPSVEEGIRSDFIWVSKP